jgi:alpha-glucuronidase
MKRKGVIIIICVMGVCLGCTSCNGPAAEKRVGGDDGYQLWLKYKKVGDPQKLKAYQQEICHYDVFGNSPTCKAIQEELKAGLNGLLGKEVPRAGTAHTGMRIFPTGCMVMVGTPGNCDIIKKLNYPELGNLDKEGYIIRTTNINGNRTTVITANEDIGLLYGTFHFLRLLQTGQSIDKLNIVSVPQIRYRVIDHWDNLDGVIERGYGGRSLWKWDEPQTPEDRGRKTEDGERKTEDGRQKTKERGQDARDTKRYIDYARANTSIGINGAVLNNVNASAKILTKEYLERIAKFAEVLRPYGIRVFLSANFSSPVSSSFKINGNTYRGIGDLNTSDPLDPRVREWWKDKVKEIYTLIPDFGGFLVKANSEGMPGPQDFGRTHADGANMLAEALKPYHGIVMWRAFVYDEKVDPDRLKRAYKEFVPLDGKFDRNVFVQAKNGPLDFQPREPVQALFGAMPHTPLLLELQITQEYLGHSTHLVYLAPMWKEYLDFDTYAKGKGSTLASVVDGTLNSAGKMPATRSTLASVVDGTLEDAGKMPATRTGIAGVANTGNDRNWCGHFFAQANWYAFGRLAWDHQLSAEQIADEWVRMTLSNDDKVVAKVKQMMMGSWETCVNYMTPLGLHHIMQADFHYGPGPDYNKANRADWNSTYYHRADANGIGFDRTTTGSNAVSQYYPPVRDMFNDINTCPEKYLLWFHRVGWNYKMKSGRTLWDELCYKYYSGTDYVNEMIKTWESLEKNIDPEIYASVKAKLEKQKVDAGIWRDTCLEYFGQFSKQPIKKN